MVWWLFAPKPERADTMEAADLHRSRLHSTRPTQQPSKSVYEIFNDPFRLLAIWDLGPTPAIERFLKARFSAELRLDLLKQNIGFGFANRSHLDDEVISKSGRR
jgi:hypothetical protein